MDVPAACVLEASAAAASAPVVVVVVVASVDASASRAEAITRIVAVRISTQLGCGVLLRLSSSPVKSVRVRVLFGRRAADERRGSERRGSVVVVGKRKKKKCASGITTLFFLFFFFQRRGKEVVRRRPKGGRGRGRERLRELKKRGREGCAPRVESSWVIQIGVGWAKEENNAFKRCTLAVVSFFHSPSQKKVNRRRHALSLSRMRSRV